MNAKQIDKHRKVSSNQKGAKPTGVWAEWFNEMATKTVIKKLVKKLPMGEELANVVAQDDKPIEAEVIEQKTEEKDVDLNSLLSTPIQEESKAVEIQIENEPTAKDKMIKELTDRGATPRQASNWCKGKGEVLQTF